MICVAFIIIGIDAMVVVTNVIIIIILNTEHQPPQRH